MKPSEYPVGSRLLICWYIRADSSPSSYSSFFPVPELKLNADQITEVHLLEYSPSGNHVRLRGRHDEPRVFAGEDGWYAVHRIHVIEVLP